VCIEVTEEKGKKLRVGIIMGGLSSEKEVSLESGRNIYNKMDRRRFEPIPIFMDGRARLWEIPLKLLMRNSTSDVEEDLTEEGTLIPYESLKERVDVVFLGLHGKYGEDGCIQGLLELLKIPYTGSGVLASALGMNKYMARRVLKANGIDTPRSILVTKKDWEESPSSIEARIEAEVQLPCVVKPIREGCSTAVKKVVRPKGIGEALEEVWKWDPAALVEEFIEGVEVTCGVLEEDPPLALTPSETIPTEDILSLEDKFLYGKGENKTPARVPAEILERIKETAVSTFKILGIRGYARIDMFVRKDGRVAVLEPNTLPGMTPSTVLFHQAAAHGLTQTDLISRIIDYALKAHHEKRGPL